MTQPAHADTEKATPRPDLDRDLHYGHRIWRSAGRYIVAVCPYGHLLTTIKAKEWSGSWAEADAAFPKMVACYGTLPKNAALAAAEGKAE